MTHIRLIHWNADEVAARAATLEELGYDVLCFSDSRANPKELLDRLPDLFVIDLGRIPSQGRELAGWLRRRKATRHVPILFIEGDPAKTERVRRLLPDAAFSTWGSVDAVIAAAIETKLDSPVVPGTMDAYAGVPLVEKLGIRAGTALALVDAPEGFLQQLGTLPERTEFITTKRGAADTVCLFAGNQAALDGTFDDASERLAEGGKLWIAWPKKNSGVDSDLSETIVRAYGLTRGLVDYKIASIDRVWSGLCFARRKPD